MHLGMFHSFTYTYS